MASVAAAKAHENQMGSIQVRIGSTLDPNLAGLLVLMPDSSRRLRRAGEGYDGGERGYGCLLVSYSPL